MLHIKRYSRMDSAILVIKVLAKSCPVHRESPLNQSWTFSKQDPSSNNIQKVENHSLDMLERTKKIVLEPNSHPCLHMTASIRNN